VRMNRTSFSGSALATRARRLLTATALAALATGGSLLGAGTASATTLQADGCAATVTGQVGDRVAVGGESVKDLVRTAAREQSSLFGNPDALAEEIAGKTLVVGKVPDASSANIGGSIIGSAVRTALSDTWSAGLHKTDVLDHIADKVTAACGLTVRAANYVSPNQPAATPPGGPGTPAPGLPGPDGTFPPGTGPGAAPPRDYTNIPVAVPGLAVPPGVRYPSSSPIPGQQSPEFGILGGDSTQQSDVRTAGNADAMTSSGSTGTIELPMLLAVVALAGVTAALVRTWVLRRTST
jgi:hypothetical protein